MQEAQERAQEQAQSMAKLSRRPEEVLRDLENEAEVLKNLHQKISQQLHMLQVHAQLPPSRAETTHPHLHLRLHAAQSCAFCLH